MKASTQQGALRARYLSREDYDLVFELVSLRERSGLSQTDVADRLGISQQAISKFERMESDPRLSTIRSYAHAIEALVSHKVVQDIGQLVFHSKQHLSLNFVISPQESPIPVVVPGHAPYSLAA